MRQRLILFMIILTALYVPLSLSQTDITPVSLSLTLYTDGTTKVDYHAQSDPTKVRVYAKLFGEGLENILVRDEDGNPLRVILYNNTAQVDSIGAFELYFTYLTSTLTYEEDSIWVVNVTSPVDVTIILPEKAQFLDMSEIPIDIGYMGESQYIKFSPGTQYIYYLLGLPSILNEANASIIKTNDYLIEKSIEGYILTGAEELLLQAIDLFEDQKYLDAKENADDALSIAMDIVGYANNAQFAISAAEDSIQEAISEARTEGLEGAEQYLYDAQSFYEEGGYREAEISAQLAADAASDARKPSDNSMLYVGAIIVIVLTAVVAFKLQGPS